MEDHSSNTPGVKADKTSYIKEETDQTFSQKSTPIETIGVRRSDLPIKLERKEAKVCVNKCKTETSLKAPEDFKKRNRLRTKQRKLIRKLLDSGVKYEEALKLVLDIPAGEQSTTTSNMAVEISLQDHKRQKISYKDEACSIKVGIIHKHHPSLQLDSFQLNKLSDAIEKEIRKVAIKGTTSLQFNSTSQRPGWLILNCHNKITRDWLCSIVKSLSPWKGAELCMVEGKNLPRLCTASVVLPKSDMSLAEILQHLRLQNPTLSVKEWKILQRTDVNNGELLIFAIDELSKLVLSSMNNRPFFLMDRKEFRVEEDKKEDENFEISSIAHTETLPISRGDNPKPLNI